MPTKNKSSKPTDRRISEALKVLKLLGLPREQQNERSALTLLALLKLGPADRWRDASDPLMGITPMMEFFSANYGKSYAPNTRETVRRFSVHQFLQAGLIVANPDNPERPTNSPKAVYQIEARALGLLRQFGKPGWTPALKRYLASTKTLKEKYARERKMKLVPVKVAKGKTIRLSPGGQNELIKRIIEEFCPRFTPGGRVVYVGDAGKKWAYFDERLLRRLGVEVDKHGKMPDVIVFWKRKKWLIFVEAVTSHGPISPKRRSELRELFKGCRARLVYITAFLDRGSMGKYHSEVSWETEVWLADSPSHLIHFNGEKFLGPYGQ